MSEKKPKKKVSKTKRLSDKDFTLRSRLPGPFYNKEGKRVKSVSTVMSELAKPNLLDWAWRLGKEGVDYKTHRDELASIGKLAHEMILSFFRTGDRHDGIMLNEYTPLQVERAEACFGSFKSWESVHDVDPVFVEFAWVSEIFQYGGRLDFFGYVDEVLTLQEFKTGKWAYADNWYQLAGLNQVLKEFFEEDGKEYPEIKSFAVLNIPRSKGESFEYSSREEVDIEWDIFSGLLQIYEGKKALRQKGYKV